MDGIRTGEQVWTAHRRGAHRGVEGQRTSIPRALRELDRKAQERHPEGRSLLARAAGWWMRGWVAFVAVMGEPYISLGGRADERAVEDAGDDEERRCT